MRVWWGGKLLRDKTGFCLYVLKKKFSAPSSRPMSYWRHFCSVLPKNKNITLRAVHLVAGNTRSICSRRAIWTNRNRKSSRTCARRRWLRSKRRRIATIHKTINNDIVSGSSCLVSLTAGARRIISVPSPSAPRYPDGRASCHAGGGEGRDTATRILGYPPPRVEIRLVFRLAWPRWDVRLLVALRRVSSFRRVRTLVPTIVVSSRLLLFIRYRISYRLAATPTVCVRVRTYNKTKWFLTTVGRPPPVETAPHNRIAPAVISSGGHAHKSEADNFFERQRYVFDIFFLFTPGNHRLETRKHVESVYL